jgi:hypothetical protein
MIHFEYEFMRIQARARARGALDRAPNTDNAHRTDAQQFVLSGAAKRLAKLTSSTR